VGDEKHIIDSSLKLISQIKTHYHTLFQPTLPDLPPQIVPLRLELRDGSDEWVKREIKVYKECLLTHKQCFDCYL
jgi:hypothetical protein